MSRYFLIVFILFLLSACHRNGPEWDALTRAEVLTQAEPDSAYRILDSIPDPEHNTLFSARLKLAKADCIYYSDELTAENDSSISEAINYFKSQGDKRRLTRAYFLRGNQRADAGEHGRAIVDLLSAEECAIKCGDSIALGLIYRGMFENYDQLEDMSSALAFMEKSYKIFDSLQSRRYLGWIMYDYARALNNTLQYKDAINILEKTFEYSILQGDEKLYNDCVLFLGQLYNYTNEHQQAVDYFRRYDLSKSYEDANRQYWMDFGRSLVELGRIDEAKAMQDSLTKYFPDEYYLNLLIAYKANNQKDIIKYQKSLVNEQDSAFKTLYNREFANIVDSYYKEQQVASEAREQRDRAVIAGVAIVALMLGVALWVDARRRRTERRNSEAVVKLLEENLRIRESEHLAHEADSDRRIAGLRRELKEQLRARLAAAEKMTRDLGAAPESKKELAVYRNMRRSLAEFAPGSDYLKSVESALDEMLGDIIAGLRRDYTDLKETDVAMFVYLVLGVPTQVCAAVMGVTLSAVYSRKSRLRSRVAALPNADRYLMYFDAQ